MSSPKVLVIGVGGVGAVVAYSLFYKAKCQVSVVVRRDYQKVKDQGYQINSVDHGKINNWKPNKIFSSVEEAAEKEEEFDFVVITTKNLPDIIKIEELIEPLMKSSKPTTVLIQNGFDIGRPIINKYPNNVCLSGVTFIGSHNHEGVITQTQKEVTQIAYFPNKNLANELQESKAKEFIELYSHDKNEVSYSADSKYSRYRKLVYNGTLNTICTLVGTDTGRLELAGGNEAIVIPAMKEIIQVAKADGVEIPLDTINTMLHDDDFDYFTPSMAVDESKGNPLELEVILGNLLTVAKEVKVETPVLSVIYNLLKVVQFRLKEKNGLVEVPEKRPSNPDKQWV